MAYISRELIDVQNPTKGKIYITVNNKMDLQLHGVPSFGERTEDGKCYDYEKEVVTSLTLKECVQLLAFTDADKLSASVSFGLNLSNVPIICNEFLSILSINCFISSGVLPTYFLSLAEYR